MRDLTERIDLEKHRQWRIENKSREWIGGNCEFLRDPILEEIYDRKNLGLKVFTRAWEDHHEIDIRNVWAEERMHEIAIIHNILAFEGLACRVYDVVKIAGYYALVVEFLEGDAGFNSVEEGVELSEGITKRKNEIGIFNEEESGRADNYIHGKIIDLNLCHFTDFEKYKNSVLQKLQNAQEVGAGGFQAYQIFEGLPGKRNTKYRVEKLKLDEDDFNGKIVLDFGCSVGAFCQEAAKRGAKRVFGFDYEYVCQAAREWANLNHYYNIDFIGMELCRYPEQVYVDIVKATGYERFDIIFFLSMVRWTGIMPWIYDKFDYVLYCEEHPDLRQIEVPPPLKTTELGTLQLEPWDTNRRIFKVYL